VNRKIFKLFAFDYVMVRFSFVFIIVLLSLPSVFSVGIAYNRDMLFVTYHPNSVVELRYFLSSNGEAAAVISVGGDFAQFATYERIVPITESLTPFIVKYTFPSFTPKPGIYEARISATQHRPKAGGQFSFLLGAQVPLKIRVLDPGKYIELSSFAVHPANALLGEYILFTIAGTNYGEKEIAKAKGVISVFYNNQSIATLTTNEQPLRSEEGGQFQAVFPTKKLEPGEYTARAKILYDDKETPPSHVVFYVGNEEIIVQNYTKTVTNETINKFLLKIMSQWNVPIDFSALVTFIKEGKEITSVHTSPEKIYPWIPGDIEFFVDTTGFFLGKYDINMTFFTDRKQFLYQGYVDVIEGKPNVIFKEIKTTEIIETPAPISELNLFFLISALFFFMAINFVVLFAYNKQIRLKNEKRR